MKKSLLSIVFLTLSMIFVNAQNLSLKEDSLDLDVSYVGDPQIYSVATKLYNDSPNDITVNWNLIDPVNSLIPEWGGSSGFCNDEVCTVLAFSTSAKFTIFANDSVELKAQVSPANFDGSTTWLFELEDSANTADMLQLEFTIAMQKDFTSISEVEKNSINLYPNPSTGVINFSNNGLKDVSKIEIYNVIGTLVRAVPFTNTISVDDLENGLYLIKMYDSKEYVFQTQTFVKR